MMMYWLVTTVSNFRSKRRLEILPVLSFTCRNAHCCGSPNDYSLFWSIIHRGGRLGLWRRDKNCWADFKFLGGSIHHQHFILIPSLWSWLHSDRFEFLSCWWLVPETWPDSVRAGLPQFSVSHLHVGAGGGSCLGANCFPPGFCHGTQCHQSCRFPCSGQSRLWTFITENALVHLWSQMAVSWSKVAQTSVTKVVSKDDSGDNGFCQNPVFASGW